jgi:hypothetical protein
MQTRSSLLITGDEGYITADFASVNTPPFFFWDSTESGVKARGFVHEKKAFASS